MLYQMGFYNHEFVYVSNGVRQGGMLSPYCFTVHIDDLSNVLNSAGIGCHIHNCCTNHVFYAVYLCVQSYLLSEFAQHLCKVWFYMVPSSG